MIDVKMNIGCISSSSGYMQAKMMISSLIANNKDKKIDFYIVSNELEEEDIKDLQSISELFQVHLIKVDSGVFDGIHEKQHYGIYTYFRIILYKILPLNIDRILWLDTDLVIDGELSDFYYCELKDYAIAACRDTKEYVKDGFSKAIIERCGLDGEQPYFNAGVMLLNLSKLRQLDLANEMLNYLFENMDIISFADQDIYNLFFGKNTLFVSNKYNYIPSKTTRYSEEIVKPIIIHYAGREKPNSYKYVDFNGSYTDRFWHYYLGNSVIRKAVLRIEHLIYRIYYFFRYKALKGKIK